MYWAWSNNIAINWAVPDNIEIYWMSAMYIAISKNIIGQSPVCGVEICIKDIQYFQNSLPFMLLCLYKTVPSRSNTERN